MTTTTPGVSPPTPQLVLNREWTAPNALLAGLWQSRELCWTLARKDFFVRYRRAAFGALWAIALPVVQAVVLSVVLSRVAKISVPHYSVFIFSGIVGWSYFAATLATGATAIVDNAALSSKIYFPRAVLPISVCISNLFALLISIGVLLVVAVVNGVHLGWNVLLILPASLLAILLSTSLTLTLSAVHVYLRDVTYAVQAALLVWFYVTPVFYPLTLLHGGMRALVEVNPVTGVIQLFHAAVTGLPVHWVTVVATAAWSVSLACVAMVLHCRYDRSIADLL